MARFTRTLLLSAATLVLAAPALRADPSAPTPPLAGTAQPPAATAAQPAAPETKTDDAAPTRRYHSTLAASLADSMPKFDPPKPVVKKAEDDDVDLRDVDKPKNRIIRLPEYKIQAKKPPIFRERDINTTKGLADIAMRRYLSDADRALNRYQIPLFGTSNEARALAMYQEDERLKNMADLEDSARTAGKADPKEAAEIRRMNQDANMRWSDFGYQSKNKD